MSMLAVLRKGARFRSLVLAGLFVLPVASRGRTAVPEEDRPADLEADTWVAVDGFGRTLPGFAECGPPRPGRTVAMFYWTWHLPSKNPGVGGVHDNTRIVAEALAEGRPPRWPAEWRNHFWGEPELGYYRSTDPFVLRKHASMLADAGVDVIVFDTTNPPWTWKEAYEALGREFTAMRREGNRTPDIAFLCPFGDPTVVVEKIYEDLYKPGRYRDLWFRWKGKPLVVANPDYFRSSPEIAEFFTFRRPIPGYWTRPTGPNQWPWLQVHPQHGFPNEEGGIEIVAVGVAQNAIPGAYVPAPMNHRDGAMGRSWHDGARDPSPSAVFSGPNFQEQWVRALELDPEVVFVTGWNEWTAIRLRKFGEFREGRDAIHPGGGLFVDEYDWEYSRDIEPMKGGHGDNYYYQLVAAVRRFKGVRPRPMPTGPSAIEIDGRFEDWDPVVPAFRDTVGDTLHRDHPGYGGLVYTNDTGRNDIVLCKAAYDRDRLYLYAETRSALTPPEDRNWMLLFIDADQDPDTGWQGYDLLVNLDRDPERGTASVHRLRGSTPWTETARARWAASGRRLEISLPRTLVDPGGEEPPSFDFHWADNIRRIAVEEFGVNGDSAPNRRFNYRYGNDPAPGSVRTVRYFADVAVGSTAAGELPETAAAGLEGASWIWRAGVADAGDSAPVETVLFRRRVAVREEDARLRWVLTLATDNEAVVRIDGKPVGPAIGWKTPAVYPVRWESGEHVVQITARNTGDSPNPAGIIARIAARTEEGTVRVLTATGDGEWQAARTPSAEGSAPLWEPALAIGPAGCAPWGPLEIE